MDPSAVFLKHVPRPPLDRFIESLWYCDGYLPPHAKERRLPTGTAEFIINLRDDSFRLFDAEANCVGRVRGPLVCGPRARPEVIDTACQESVIGVHFKAGGTLPFVDVPADELSNAHVSLGDLWGPAAEELRERLLEANTPRGRLALLEAALLAHVVRRPAWHPAVAIAIEAFQARHSSLTVADVARKIGISQRRLIQVFREEVGLTPKLFCRLRRFQQALHLVHGCGKADWTGVALTSGFFDQAHLIHDFQQFAGFSPAAYLRRRGEHPNHLPLVD